MGKAAGRPPAAGGRPRGGADPARRAALDLLLAVDQRDAYANLVLRDLLRERGLTGRDAALATELAYGTLRGRGSYDAVLAICYDRALAALDPAVLAVLRLGAHQLLATRIAPHAAVATSVGLVRQVAGPRPAGLVNAVLRRVATRDLAAWLDIAAPDRTADPVGHLAVRYSHPRWIVAAVAAALGGDLAETEPALAADNDRPLVHLAALPGARRDLLSAGCAPARWSAYGAYLAQGGDPSALPPVASGLAWVQDEASQLAAIALARAPLGEAGRTDASWLDLCAGPGGKARLLAGLAPADGARLLAAELRAHRARLVQAALAAAARRPAAGAGQGAGPAAIVVADGRMPAWRPGSFGRVLADVPCSGLGALRRRPDARWQRTGLDPGLPALQRELLLTALDAAGRGCVVGYVTCSPHVAETREVVAAVLAQRPGTEVLDAPAVLAEVPGLGCPAPYQRYAQFWPHRHGTDAIFVALLRRGG